MQDDLTSAQLTNRDIAGSSFDKLIDIGGYKLHLISKGEGKQTVVFESGVGAWSLYWLKTQEELSKFARVVIYDRAGYGQSDPSPYSRSVEQIADELYVALKNANIPSPYILVGHSFGGFVVKTLAKKHPGEVSALVLAESANERQFDYLPPIVKFILEKSKEINKTTAEAIRTKKFDPNLVQVDPWVPVNLKQDFINAKSKASFYETFYNEMYMLPISVVQSQITTPLNIPTMVFTARNSGQTFSGLPGWPLEEYNKKWLELQSELLNISTNSKQIISDKATHDLQSSAPDELIMVIKLILH